MTYVEWLRVRNVLRILAIVLGILILISLIMRISFNRYVTDDSAFIQHVQMAPGAKVSHEMLPNGVNRTIIDDPGDSTHVIVDNLGYGGRHIVITEPRSKSKHHGDHVTIGSVEVKESVSGNTATTVIDTNGSVPFIFYMIVADVMAFVIATVLGAPFARENDGHLEYALTKPVQRTSFALQTMGVDIAGIVAASVLTIVALIVCQAMFEVPHFDFSGVNLQAILIGIAAPLAWYAMLNAASASMRRGYGAVLGFAWPVAILVTVFAAISWGDSLVGQTVHGIFWVIARIDPLTYLAMPAHSEAMNTPLASAPHFALRISLECLLFLVYVTLALFQWRRVEA